MICSHGDKYLDQLDLSKFGLQDENNLTVTSTSIFRSIGDLDFFSGLIQELENNGYKEGTDLYVFPYDWRLNINTTAANLKNEINYIKNKTDAQKVDIIAHSMGGIVVKDYISQNTDNSIDKFIDIATPQLGAPKVFKMLNYGDNLDICPGGFCILDTEEVKSISQNMPSAYQLLPSRQYFASDIPGLPATNGYIYDIIGGNQNVGILRALNYDQSISYLENQGRNSFLLGDTSINSAAVNVNDELHGRIDNLANSDNYYNIIGCGQATYSGIQKKGTENWELPPINGDGTVPLKSALPFGSHIYFDNGTTHPYIPSDNGVPQLITSILQGNENNFNFSQYSNLGQVQDRQTICKSIYGTQIGSHSPVRLQIYDELGNHTGPLSNGVIEESIPGVTYDILGHDTYAFLPAGHTYHVVNQATSSGELGITIQKIANDQETQFVYYNGIKLLSASTSVSYDVSDNQTSYQATVDPDGSGQKDQVITPSSILTGDQINDVTAPSSTIIISSQTGNNGYYTSNVNVQLSAVDNVGGSGVLKTEYSLDNGQTWSDYQGVFAVSKAGTTTIEYYSIDKAGNQEEQQEKIIKIDKTAPVISILLPQENQEIGHDQALTPTYFTSDNFSGVAASTAKIYFDNQILTSSTVDLYRQTLGAHKIKISIRDLAGNLASTTVDFSIITDINGTISDVNRSYNEKMISKDQVRKDLVNALTDIQIFQTKYGSKIAKEQDLKAKAMTLCLKRKSQSWCSARIGTIFDRFEYQLSKVNQLLINLKYQVILVTLDLDLKLKVINSTGYDIIKGDIKYLISNI